MGSHVLHVATQAAGWGIALSPVLSITVSSLCFLHHSISLLLSPCFLLFSPSLAITLSHLSFFFLLACNLLSSRPPLLSLACFPPSPSTQSGEPVGAGALLAGTVCVWV